HFPPFSPIPFFFSTILRPTTPTLFPYTTLFRSPCGQSHTVASAQLRKYGGPIGGHPTDAWRTGDDLMAFDYGRKGSTTCCHSLMTDGRARRISSKSNPLSHLRFA